MTIFGSVFFSTRSDRIPFEGVYMMLGALTEIPKEKLTDENLFNKTLKETVMLTKEKLEKEELNKIFKVMLTRKLTNKDLFNEILKEVVKKVDQELINKRTDKTIKERVKKVDKKTRKKSLYEILKNVVEEAGENLEIKNLEMIIEKEELNKNNIIKENTIKKIEKIQKKDKKTKATGETLNNNKESGTSQTSEINEGITIIGKNGSIIKNGCGCKWLKRFHGNHFNFKYNDTEYICDYNPNNEKNPIIISKKGNKKINGASERISIGSDKKNEILKKLIEEFDNKGNKKINGASERISIDNDKKDEILKKLIEASSATTEIFFKNESTNISNNL